MTLSLSHLTPVDWKRIGEHFHEDAARGRAFALDAAGQRERQRAGAERNVSSASGFNEQRFAGSEERAVHGVRPRFKDFRR